MRNRGEADLTFELPHDVFRNDESKAYSIDVAVLRALDEPEELEELVLVLEGDADPGVFNLDVKVVPSLPFLLFSFNYLSPDGDSSFPREFEGVRLEIQ